MKNGKGARITPGKGLWWNPPLGPVRIPPTDRPAFFSGQPSLLWAQMFVPGSETA